jgi:hypothetical protein
MRFFSTELLSALGQVFVSKHAFGMRNAFTVVARRLLKLAPGTGRR